MTVAADIQQTLDELTKVYGAGGIKITAELAKDLNVAAGLQAYNLEVPARLLFPVLSPIRNKLPREKGRGKAVEFKAITSADTNARNGIAIEKQLAPQIATQTADVIINYRSFGLSSDPVTFEGQWSSEGFQDLRALAVANLLKALMIAEEKLILFGRGSSGQIVSQGGLSWTLGGAIGSTQAPTLAAQSTGGAIPASTTVYVVQTVHDGFGESVASAVASVTTGAGSTNSVVVTPYVPANAPALTFNIYAGSAAGGPFYYVGSSNGADVTITAVPTSGQQPPAADGSYDPNSFNGILSYLFAGGSNAYIKRTKAQLADVDIPDALQSLYDTGRADPDVVYLQSGESRRLTNITLGAANTPYFLVVDNQRGATANYRVARLVNPVTGKDVRVEVHPFMQKGTILILSEGLPSWYPGAGVSAPFAMDLVQDYLQIDYPPTAAAPYWVSEIRAYGALKGYIPFIHGVLVVENS
ncbi:MAG: hypothetical protein QJR03_12155 [Sphaerobacter sp.]|nr:hypothetical protein [Sphaerobacter sp.]